MYAPRKNIDRPLGWAVITDEAERRNEALIHSQIGAPFEITAPSPEAPPCRLIFTSPHSGAAYPPAWLAGCRLTGSELRQAEDAYVDALCADAPRFGAPLLAARFARSFVDVNRGRAELWPEALIAPTPEQSAQLQTPRARAGLGVIARAIAENALIYKTPPSAERAEARLLAFYDPYHHALGTLIDAAKAKAGSALIIDCHSMPGFGPLRARRPDFILGDRFGQACAPEVMEFTARTLMAMGYEIGRNHPYAGGYVTEHYGKPKTGTQALQIEINRDLYMNGVTLQKTRGYDPLARNMSALCAALITRFGNREREGALAAE